MLTKVLLQITPCPFSRWNQLCDLINTIFFFCKTVLLKLHLSINLPPAWFHFSKNFLQALRGQIWQWGQRLLLSRFIPQPTSTLRVWHRRGVLQSHFPKGRICRVRRGGLQTVEISWPHTAMRIRRWRIKKDLTLIFDVFSSALCWWTP